MSTSAAPLAPRSNKGQGTFFTPALGACGFTNKESDLIVAVSAQLFDSAGKGGNPNKNPLCNKFITAHFKGKSVRAKVVDSCPGCKLNDLDFSPAAFKKLASEDLGRIDITWDFS
ncbi:hypothetical protein DENSPDRAFT_885058 [Dentipellis sp. KUC8613]|nr:hypothetical protein DENSPDRAFT_885058 [Dentipellis sp. KUC8613]